MVPSVVSTLQDLGDNLPKNKGKKVNTTLELMVLNDDDLSPKFIQRFFHVKIFGNVSTKAFFENFYYIHSASRQSNTMKIT